MLGFITNETRQSGLPHRFRTIVLQIIQLVAVLRGRHAVSLPQVDSPVTHRAKGPPRWLNTFADNQGNTETRSKFKPSLDPLARPAAVTNVRPRSRLPSGQLRPWTKVLLSIILAFSSARRTVREASYAAIQGCMTRVCSLSEAAVRPSLDTSADAQITAPMLSNPCRTSGHRGVSGTEVALLSVRERRDKNYDNARSDQHCSKAGRRGRAPSPGM